MKLTNNVSRLSNPPTAPRPPRKNELPKVSVVLAHFHFKQGTLNTTDLKVFISPSPRSPNCGDHRLMELFCTTCQVSPERAHYNRALVHIICRTRHWVSWKRGHASLWISREIIWRVNDFHIETVCLDDLLSRGGNQVAGIRGRPFTVRVALFLIPVPLRVISWGLARPLFAEECE